MKLKEFVESTNIQNINSLVVHMKDASYWKPYHYGLNYHCIDLSNQCESQKENEVKLFSDFYIEKINYDKNNISNQVINLCKEKFIEGPNKISQEELTLLDACILAKIEDLKTKDKFDEFEYQFLTNLYLKDIIVGYFIKNNKWIPKDKKLFKVLKDENIEIFNLCKKAIKTYKYEDLINAYRYIFKEEL